ncbi:TIM barrel protein [soil metagenome]
MLRALLKSFLFMALVACNSRSPEHSGLEENTLLFSKDNLVAWCIVPYDKENRTPQQRAAMLNDLEIRALAWDWRAEHLPVFEEEIQILKDNDIELAAVWFWITGMEGEKLDEASEKILQTLEKTNTQTVLWVSFPGNFFEGMTDEDKILKGANTLKSIHERANKIGCKIALYNHGDWFGEPENQVKIIETSGLDDVGLVYNFHHAHYQIKDFDKILEIALPYLWTVNLNGLRAEGPKILTIGEGNLEQEMMKKLKESGFAGTIGILGHTENEDVKKVLQRNLEGLKKVLEEMGEEVALQTYE